jgi:CelD/BcsL family acetyltransferase involved in cellulose biosynthesis
MSGPELSARVHYGRAGLLELRAAWQQLVSRLARRRFFHEWAWFDAWLHELEPQPDGVLFVELQLAGRCVAIVPLVARRQRRAGLNLRVLALPEHDHLPLADILCDRDVDGAQVLRALMRGLAQAGIAWDLLRFSMVMEESPLVAGVAAAGTAWRAELIKICAQVDCDMSWEQFAARLSGNFRSNLNKARHKLAREAGVRFDIAATEAEINAVFDTFLAVEASGWKGAKGTAIACRPELVRFYRRLIAHFAPEDRLRINTLSVGEHVIAAQFCPLDGDTLYVYKLGYDEEYSRFAPGNSLIEKMVRVGGEQRRFRWLNLVGNPPWFEQWKPSGSEVRLFLVYGPTWRARALRGLQRLRTLLRRTSAHQT